MLLSWRATPSTEAATAAWTSPRPRTDGSAPCRSLALEPDTAHEPARPRIRHSDTNVFLYDDAVRQPQIPKSERRLVRSGTSSELSARTLSRSSARKARCTLHRGLLRPALASRHYGVGWPPHISPSWEKGGPTASHRN